MKKVFVIGYWLLVIGSIFIKPIFAQETCGPGAYCSDCSFITSPGGLVEGAFDTIEFSFKPEDTTKQYIIESDGPGWVPVQLDGQFRSGPIPVDTNGRVSITIYKSQAPRLFVSCEALSKQGLPFECPGTHLLHIRRKDVSETDYCDPWAFDVVRPTPTPLECELRISPETGITNTTEVFVKGNGLPNTPFSLRVLRDPAGSQVWGPETVTVRGGEFGPKSIGVFGDGNYVAQLHTHGGAPWNCRGGRFSVGPYGTAPTPVPVCPQDCVDKLKGPHPDDACKIDECREKCSECRVQCPQYCIDILKGPNPDIACIQEDCRKNCLECGATAPTPLPTPPEFYKICTTIKDSKEQKDCMECIRDTGGMWTAIGCIPTDIPTILKEYIFPTGLGIAGGIAFLLILFGGFTVLTSAGNPEQVAKGKELITSALVGLLIIIFSVLILKLIGVEIFKIPGFE